MPNIPKKYLKKECKGSNEKHLLSITLSIFGVAVGEVLSHTLELDALLVQVGHRDLVVPRWVVLVNFGCLHELLLPADDLLQPFGIQHIVRRHEELQLLLELLVEALLVRERTHEVGDLGVVSFLGGACRRVDHLYVLAFF